MSDCWWHEPMAKAYLQVPVDAASPPMSPMPSAEKVCVCARVYQDPNPPQNIRNPFADRLTNRFSTMGWVFETEDDDDVANQRPLLCAS